MKTPRGMMVAGTTVFIAFVSFTSFKYTLSNDGRAIKSPFIENDTASISQLLSAVEQNVRSKDYISLARVLSIAEDFKKHEEPTGQRLNEIGFHIKQKDLRFVKSDSAVVICDLSDYETVSRTGIVLTLKKEGRWWRIDKNSELTVLLRSFIIEGVAKQSKNANDKRSDSEPPNSSPTIAQILIPEKHPGTRSDMNIYVINQSLTRQYMDANLFCPTSKLDMDVVTTDLSGWEIGFTLDHEWGRIVYGWQRTGDKWLKSYGDNPGDHRFFRPSALANDPFDTLFVSERGSGKVIKLFYNRGARLITFVSEIVIPGITEPEDITFDQGNDVCSPADDGIWIADYLRGQLVMINRAGSVVKTITHYQLNSTVYPLRAEKVVASRFRPLGVTGPYIGVINTQRTYWPFQDFFVTLDAGSISGTTATAIRSTEYPTGAFPRHNLVSLGIDIFGQFWAGDDGAKQYHTYSQMGDYLASYASNPAGSPVSISRTRLHFQPGCSSLYSIISIHTADPWGANTGLNYFLPGADVVNLAARRWTTNTGNDFNVFNWTATNKCYLTVKVRDPSTGAYVKTLQEGPTDAGHYSVSVPHYELPYGNLQLHVWHRPYYDHLYPHPRGDSWREITFYNRRPISDVAVTRIPGSPPTYVATVSGGEPPFNYMWTMKLKCCSGASPAGGDGPDPTCSWQDARSANGNTLSMPDPPYSFWVRATAFDSQGSSKDKILYIEQRACISVPGGGCPFVFVWDGQHFVEDNNILPQSEAPENRGRDVVDRYKLMQPPVPRNNQYVLQIREFENERSYLDQVKLVAVDHNSNREVAMNAAGDVVSYEKKFKLKHARLRARDVSQRVMNFDSSSVGGGAGAILDFGFTPNNGGGRNSADDESPFFGLGDTDFVLDGGGFEEEQEEKSRPLVVVSTNAAGMTSVVGNLNFRRNSSLVALPLALSDSSSMQLIFSDSVQLDYVNLGRVKSENVSVYDLSLQQALYDGYLSVKDRLTSSDSVYAELAPVHFIELRYALPPRLPNGKKRTFFLVSKGRYERIPDSSSASLTKAGSVEPEIPKVLALQQNYPNPFNPSTTIRIDLPQQEYARVVVYDILGREVVALRDGNLPAGYHPIVWDGKNSSGIAVNSGVYFARLRVFDSNGGTKFLATRKMLLTK